MASCSPDLTLIVYSLSPNLKNRLGRHRFKSKKKGIIDVSVYFEKNNKAYHTVGRG